MQIEKEGEIGVSVLLTCVGLAVIVFLLLIPLVWGLFTIFLLIIMIIGVINIVVNDGGDNEKK